MQAPRTHQQKQRAAGLIPPAKRNPDTRPSARQRGYSPQWDAYAKSVLRKQPYCERCKRPGHIVDHIVPIRAGGPVWGPVQVLCRSCHGVKTTEDKRRYPNAYPTAPKQGTP